MLDGIIHDWPVRTITNAKSSLKHHALIIKRLSNKILHQQSN